MYRHIMVPLDGSRFAESALPLALAISRHTGAHIHLITVQEPIPSFAYDEWENAAEEWTQSYQENVLDRLGDRATGRVTAELGAGHVVEVIEQEAAKNAIDLIVMATHGRGMFSRAWLGSVADAFVHHTSRPVLLVRPEESGAQPDLSASVELTRVLIPLDGTELSESVLDHAVEFGSLFDADYHLVRVVPYPMQFNSPYLPHTMQMNQQFVEEARETADSYLAEHVLRLRERGLRVDHNVVVVAQPGHGLLSEAEGAQCDFIAMATHARTGLSRALLGSTADKVLRGSHIPLLLYHPAP
jgi:nucleotide-binding universal stress UspA family protein